MNKWQHLIDKHQKALRAADGIFTWTAQDELAWLAEEASKREKVLEVGTYAGHSAVVLVNSTKGTVTCFDFTPDKPPDEGVAKQAMKNLFPYIRQHRLFYCQQNAGVAAVEWKRNNLDHFDMIWIDDGHTYADVVRDCLIALLLRKDESALICGHDYERPFNDVARAVNDCFGEKNIKFGPGRIWYL